MKKETRGSIFKAKKLAESECRLREFSADVTNGLNMSTLLEGEKSVYEKRSREVEMDKVAKLLLPQARQEVALENMREAVLQKSFLGKVFDLLMETTCKEENQSESFNDDYPTFGVEGETCFPQFAEIAEKGDKRELLMAFMNLVYYAKKDLLEMDPFEYDLSVLEDPPELVN